MSSALAEHSRKLIESDSTSYGSVMEVLPPAWIDAVGTFAASKLYLLKSVGPLCINLAYWHNKGLELEDAKKIFRRLCDPEIAREHKFENQLMADLASMVNDCLRRKRMVEDARIRRDAAKQTHRSVTGEVVRLADAFRMGEET